MELQLLNVLAYVLWMMAATRVRATAVQDSNLKRFKDTLNENRKSGRPISACERACDKRFFNKGQEVDAAQCKRGCKNEVFSLDRCVSTCRMARPFCRVVCKTRCDNKCEETIPKGKEVALAKCKGECARPIKFDGARCLQKCKAGKRGNCQAECKCERKCDEGFTNYEQAGIWMGCKAGCKNLKCDAECNREKSRRCEERCEMYRGKGYEGVTANCKVGCKRDFCERKCELIGETEEKAGSSYIEKVKAVEKAGFKKEENTVERCKKTCRKNWKPSFD